MAESTTAPVRAADETGDLSSHNRILRAAGQLFAHDGYEHTTTAAIARAAGTSESQLIKHFGSKEGLLEAVFEAAWLRMAAGIHGALESAGPPLERLQALTEVLFAGLEGDEDLRTLMLLEGRRIRRRGQIVVLSRGFLQLVQLLDGLFEELRRRGELRPGVDPQAARSALVGAFEGLLRDRLLAERVGYPASYGARDLRVAFAAVLDGLVLQPSSRSS